VTVLNNADYRDSEIGSNHESRLRHATVSQRIAPGDWRDMMKQEKQESD
jgi:hypothetical protein